MRRLALEAELARLSPFFGEAWLSRVRLRPLPPPLPLVAGLTLGRTVLLSRRWFAPDPLPLLFHELVHVAQYERLGAARFLWRYFLGWLRGGCRYRRIPLEAHAFDLQARFMEDRGRAFRVAGEVEARLAAY